MRLSEQKNKNRHTPSLGQAQYRNSAGPRTPRRRDPQPRPTGASRTQTAADASSAVVPLTRRPARTHHRGPPAASGCPPPAWRLNRDPPVRREPVPPHRCAHCRRTAHALRCAGAARRGRRAGSYAFHRRCPRGGLLRDAAAAHSFLAPLEGGRPEGRPAGGAVAAWLARPDGSALSNVTMCEVHCCTRLTFKVP